MKIQATKIQRRIMGPKSFLTKRLFQRNDKLPQEMDSILMSSSEKQWVTKIQMLQIQTANPYEEDYYYQVRFSELHRTKK